MKRLLALALCLGFLLCGCGTDNQAYTPTGNGLTPEQEVTAPVESAPVITSEYTLAYDPEGGFNPYECESLTNRALFSLLYQGLFSTDLDGVTAPVLCDSFSRSEDMLEYTISLASATFSDGDSVQASDVVASLEAARNSNYYGGRFSHIESYTAADDVTVVITTNTEYEDLTVLLDIPIVKQETVADLRPVGSGPYTLASAGKNLILKRCTGWWCSSDLILDQQGISLEAMDTATEIRDGFEFGKIGLVCTDPGSSFYADFRCDYEVWDCSTGIMVYLGCNTASPVLSHDPVRSALTYAMDRESMLDRFYRGFGRIATLPADPGSPYYNSALAANYRYSPGLLEEALKGEGLVGSSLTLLVNSSDNTRLQLARFIAKTLTTCGLVTTTLEKSGDSYLEALRGDDYDLYLGQTKLSPNMDLTSFFSEAGVLSYGGMRDSATYTMCLQALENSGNYYNLHQMIADDGQLIPLLFRTHAVFATRGFLTGLAPARDAVFHYHLQPPSLPDMTEETTPEE